MANAGERLYVSSTWRRTESRPGTVRAAHYGLVNPSGVAMKAKNWQIGTPARISRHTSQALHKFNYPVSLGWQNAWC